MIIIRTQQEIEEQIGKAINSLQRSRYPGMTYEQGVLDTINWLTGDTEEPPMEE